MDNLQPTFMVGSPRLILPGGRYALTRHFVLRMTGFPIELIDSMACIELAAMIDKAQVLTEQSAAAARALLRSSRNHGRVVERSLRRCLPLEYFPDMSLSEASVNEFNALLSLRDQVREQATVLYETELQRVRGLLYDFVVGKPFEEVLLLSSPGLSRFTPESPIPPTHRNSQVRQREFTWISYLQRLATKNETISFFGPSAWGEFDLQEPAAASIEIGDPFISQRSVYVERWVCEAIAKSISSDPQITPLLRLRIGDDLVLQNDQATLMRSGRVFHLTEDELEFLEMCKTSTCRTSDFPQAAGLLERGIISRDIQIPPVPKPLLSLQEEVDTWPDHPQKHLWQNNLADLDKRRDEFECAQNLEDRRSALANISESLKTAGVGDLNDSQKLYSSRLPVNEDCQLNVDKLILGKPLIDQLLGDAAPWFDLWRDLAGLYATRLQQSMRVSWHAMGGKPVPLTMFFPSIVEAWKALGKLEEEIQAAWSEQMGERCRQSVVTLTEDDTAFLRSKFKFRRMKAFDNMSPDLQIIAADKEALSDGRWKLLIAEVHPDWTPWENCFFLWCPDPQKFAADYASEEGQGTAVAIGGSLPYFSSAHTTFCVYPYAHQWVFIGGKPPEESKGVRGAEAFVKVTEDDVVVQDANGQLLGSFLHTWPTAANTHRMNFQGYADHCPRLQVGRVIVQRESWNIKPDAALLQAVKGGGEGAYSALRHFREEYGLPERVYFRGSVSERFSLDKDVKPVYVDFRNPLLAEVAAKMVGRFDRLWITEMLPKVEDCWIEGLSGHYSSEFRTVVMASRESRAEGVFSNFE